MNLRNFARVAIAAALVTSYAFKKDKFWHSDLVEPGKNNQLIYKPDAQGNILPDFSRVGYFFGDKPIPTVAVVTTISPSANAQQEIQGAIDALAKKTPDANGFRGAILLKKGRYELAGPLHIKAGGIVLRGEGNTENGTVLVYTANTQSDLIEISGDGSMQEISGSKTAITDAYVPVGTFSFNVADAKAFKPGDKVIVYRPANQKWITDLKMDQIDERNGTLQWKPDGFGLKFERTITKTEGSKVYIDNPVVMAMETQYGGGELYKYKFDGRISQVGIESIYCESAYTSDTAENHGWNAIHFSKVENGWVRNVTSRYFGYACVNLSGTARNITVTDCNSYDPKSVITGGRRYSFNNDGQLNLFVKCNATEGRHDYVTGARVCGPNVFVHCTAKNTHADIGPHHRWAAGTLYDNIVTDGEINIQDRGNWGSGHGWSGVTQIAWNCTVKRAAIQNPWVSGNNYAIGVSGEKYDGRLKGRPDAVWEGQNKSGLEPGSLYFAQLKARQ